VEVTSQGGGEGQLELETPELESSRPVLLLDSQKACSPLKTRFPSEKKGIGSACSTCIEKGKSQLGKWDGIRVKKQRGRRK